MSPAAIDSHGTRVLRFFALGSVLFTSACFAVTDLDRFNEAAPLTPSNFTDLRVTLRGMNSHINEYVEYRVIDASNVIQSRGVLKPLGGPDATFFLPGAVPKQNGPFRFDFYADHDNSGGYDKRPDTTLDHAWRLDLNDTLLDKDGAYVIVFDHNTSFTNLNNPTPPTEFGKPATIRLRGLAPFQNKRLEVRVAIASTRRVVAMYRIPVLVATEYDALVNGMMETGESYLVEVYTDDGKATPTSVKAFRVAVTAGEAGLETFFNGVNPGETPGLAQVFDAPPP